MILTLLTLHVIACYVRSEYVKLPRFRLTELHYKTVILSAQVRFEGTYGHLLVIRLLLYGLEVVLVIFDKGRQDFALRRTFRT